MRLADMMIDPTAIRNRPDTARVADLRHRIRDGMEAPPVTWDCPRCIDDRYMSEPLAVRKARAIALKLSRMPADLWDSQLFAGSMTLEHPRVHAERGFPDYLTDAEREDGRRRGVSISTVFGHIVPNYPKLLAKGLRAIRAEAEAQRPNATTPDEHAFIDSVLIALDAVMDYASRLADRCESDATRVPPVVPTRTRSGSRVEELGTRHPCADADRAAELLQMATNLRQVPRGPAQSFWQALQSVWLLHMIFHSTMNGNAMGRLDQYVWPYLQADLESGRIDLETAAELVDCFCLKFNERAKTTEDQRPESRELEPVDLSRRTRHHTSSQVGTQRDRLDATNHWLQNIVGGGLTPDGEDGTNPLTFLLLESYRRNQMTNPLLTVRLHRDAPDELVRYVCDVLKDGGGMPAMFNDEALVPALQNVGIPRPDALDYTNDGCWEVIIPGRTDFKFQRLSVMLCLEWALNRGRSRLDGSQQGPDTGDPRAFASFDDVWEAFLAQLDAMISRVARSVVDSINIRSTIAPVPLLSALIEGAIESRRDMTAGGARFRTFGMLAEGAGHAIDSLTAIKTVIFGNSGTDYETPGPLHAHPSQKAHNEATIAPSARNASFVVCPRITMAELCDALDANFEGHDALRARLLAAPKYGNDDGDADAVGRDLIDAFASAVARHAQEHKAVVKFPCGVATFSWYVGIGEGLGPSPDGRLSGEPVSSNFSPALGRDMDGLPSAILSYSKMHHDRLAVGGPLDLRMARRLVEGGEGTARMAALVRSFVDTGGSMMTLTVADAEELRAAQREPEKYSSLRVRMGGWCAYFTMLSREQQEHHIRRQEGRP